VGLSRGRHPELFVSTLALLGILALVSLSRGANTVAVVLALTLVVLSLVVTLARVRRARLALFDHREVVVTPEVEVLPPVTTRRAVGSSASTKLRS
jgi:hypothetical protein